MTRRIEAESRKDEERQYKACVDHSLRTTIAELEDPPEQYHLDESVAVLYGASADRRTVILDDATKICGVRITR